MRRRQGEITAPVFPKEENKAKSGECRTPRKKYLRPCGRTWAAFPPLLSDREKNLLPLVHTQAGMWALGRRQRAQVWRTGRQGGGRTKLCDQEQHLNTGTRDSETYERGW